MSERHSIVPAADATGPVSRRRGTAHKVLGDLPERAFLRFMERVHVNATTGCWEWVGGLDEYGYGAMRVDCQLVKCHRQSYRAFRGEFDQSLKICHECDNPQCVNPFHLFPGTTGDNAKDAVRKGRYHPPCGDDSPSRKHPERLPRGSKHVNSRLTEDQVREMRRLHATGRYPKYILAAMFGVGDNTAFCAITRKTWRHVE